MITNKFTHWITLEEHCIIGGLGSSVLEWVYDSNNANKIKIKRLGAPNDFINELGNQSFTRNKLGINYLGIRDEVLKL